MSPRKTRLLLTAVLSSFSVVNAQETVLYTESFDYPNGTEMGDVSIPWEVKLAHSRMTGVKSGQLILNQGGKRVLLFAPVQTGPAEVHIELEAAAKNKKAPHTSRFNLIASIDGGEWTRLRYIEGPFSEVVSANFSTSENFQLRIVSNGSTYAQTLTLDNLKVSIRTADTNEVSVSEPLWIENFEGLQYKQTVDTGDTAWTESSERHSYSGIVRDRFHLAPRRAVAYWETEEIDISSFASATVNAQVAYKKRVNSSLEVSVDGGEWQPLWSDQESNIRYMRTPTLVSGGLSGDSLRLRFVADKWTTIQLRSVDIHGLGSATRADEPDPDPLPSGLAQFSAVQNTGFIWHFDASTSNASHYKWFLDGFPVSNDAVFEIQTPPFPTQIQLEVTHENGSTTTISQILNLNEIAETELVTSPEGSALTWPTEYLGFSQIEIADANGNFSPIGAPIAGTGLGAHFVSSLPYAIRVAQALQFGGFDYSGENLNHLDMGGTNAPNANFADVTGRLVYLDHSDLSKSNWEGASLSFAELHDADFSGSRLINASFVDCVFDRADLSQADLTGSNFENSDFRGADLSNAILANANLTNADLRGANLDGANLSGANLSGALRD